MKNILLNRVYSLDMGSTPVIVQTLKFTETGVECKYLGSWNGRVGIIDYIFFELNGFSKVVKKEDTNKIDSFSEKKTNIVDMINKLMEEYEIFTKTVSPKNWRTTGHHFTELRKMKEDISFFSEITNKDDE